MEKWLCRSSLFKGETNKFGSHCSRQTLAAKLPVGSVVMCWAHATEERSDASCFSELPCPLIILGGTSPNTLSAHSFVDDGLSEEVMSFLVCSELC